MRRGGGEHKLQQLSDGESQALPLSLDGNKAKMEVMKCMEVKQVVLHAFKNHSFKRLGYDRSQGYGVIRGYQCRVFARF